MKKQVLWTILGAMLGAGGAVAIKPAFDSEATLKPRLEINRMVIFEMACPEGFTGSCKGLEIGASIYATDDLNARPIAQGNVSGLAVEPPMDAGVGPLARFENKAKAALRQARSNPDAGIVGKAGTITRTVIFKCESCSTVDGGMPYGIEAWDENGSASVPLDDLPPVLKRFAEDFYELKTAQDAG